MGTELDGRQIQPPIDDAGQLGDAESGADFADDVGPGHVYASHLQGVDAESVQPGAGDDAVGVCEGRVAYEDLFPSSTKSVRTRRAVAFMPRMWLPWSGSVTARSSRPGRKDHPP
ncbi:hypothetical protein AB0E78_30725 [Streptomyces sp. NPDC032198]|uniref:hypothetical protein n=1 Tax=Streptomyces sp. NPDC032198 TaxID=3155127 RepID=UPI0033CFCDCC